MEVQLKSAHEMFEDYGYKLIQDDCNWLIYDFEKKFINSNTLKLGINNLDSIQKQIIIKRYFKGNTQEEIASELFISQAQVSRLEKAAILSLKKLF